MILTKENVAEHISRTAMIICEQEPFEVRHFMVPPYVIKLMKEFLCRYDYYENRRIKRRILSKIRSKRI